MNEARSVNASCGPSSHAQQVSFADPDERYTEGGKRWLNRS